MIPIVLVFDNWSDYKDLLNQIFRSSIVAQPHKMCSCQRNSPWASSWISPESISTCFPPLLWSLDKLLWFVLQTNLINTPIWLAVASHYITPWKYFSICVGGFGQYFRPVGVRGSWLTERERSVFNVVKMAFGSSQRQGTQRLA